MAWSHDADAFDRIEPNDYPAIHALLDDAIEAAAAGAPLEIFPDPLLDTTNADMLRMIHDLIFARCYQLAFAYDLTEDDALPEDRSRDWE